MCLSTCMQSISNANTFPHPTLSLPTFSNNMVRSGHLVTVDFWLNVTDVLRFLFPAGMLIMTCAIRADLINVKSKHQYFSWIMNLANWQSLPLHREFIVVKLIINVVNLSRYWNSMPSQPLRGKFSHQHVPSKVPFFLMSYWLLHWMS